MYLYIEFNQCYVTFKKLSSKMWKAIKGLKRPVSDANIPNQERIATLESNLSRDSRQTVDENVMRILKNYAAKWQNIV